ncbi:MAG: aliphatic sulfonate ABC transporter substrate-binding protein [Rhodospirillales bacterium]|nr:MAG: aliphatic sulfonate ABC transporter substrate-binding protein [Rhodospirillales bacterium]
MKRLAIAAAMIAAALQNTSTDARADEIRFAVQPIPHYAPIFVAKSKKWVDEELTKAGKPGVELKWASFAAGPPINESFAAGQQDIGFLGDTPAIIGKSAGIDTSVIGLTSRGPKSLAVIVGAESKISSPKDLKGKKVAVTKGSYAQHLLALVLQQGGLGLNDVQVINLPNADIPNAILTGDIEAGAVWEPIITKFTTLKQVRVLADGTGIKSGVLVIIANNSFVQKKREQAKAVLRAYQRGADFIKSNPKEAAQLVSEDVKLAPDLLEQVFKNFDYSPTIRPDDFEELKKSEGYLREIGLIKSAVDINTFSNRALNAEAGLK